MLVNERESLTETGTLTAEVTAATNSRICPSRYAAVWLLLVASA